MPPPIVFIIPMSNIFAMYGPSDRRLSFIIIYFTFSVPANRYAYTRDSFGRTAAMTILLLITVIYLKKNNLKLVKRQ